MGNIEVITQNSEDEVGTKYLFRRDNAWRMANGGDIQLSGYAFLSKFEGDELMKHRNDPGVFDRYSVKLSLENGRVPEEGQRIIYITEDTPWKLRISRNVFSVGGK